MNVSSTRRGGARPPLLLLLSLLFSSFAASAQSTPTPLGGPWPPRPGIWHSPGTPGLGWNIEVQGDIAVVLHYAFKQNGAPTFYTSAGTYNAGQRRITTALNEFSGGPCIGCAFTPAQPQELGTVRFDFADTEHGQVTYPNGTVLPIERFVFGVDPDPLRQTRGLWHSTYGESGEFYADLLEIIGPCTSCDDPDEYMFGRLVGGGAERVLLAASITPGDDAILLLLDYSENYYTQYVFVQDIDHWVGFAWDFPKDENPPTTGGLPLVASRAPAMATGLFTAGDAAVKRAAMPSSATAEATDVITLPSGKALSADAVRDAAARLQQQMETLAR